VSLAERRWLRLVTLCLLYVAQGIPWGFMATTLPAYLVQRGLDFGFVTAALSFTTLPYTFKWVWGPIIDAFTIPRFGRRRPWILFAQGMMVATVVAIVAIPDLTAELRLLAWMILIHTVFNSLQDVAVDALAAELLADDERGRANGLMYASKYAGGALGGVGMGKLIASTSLSTALMVQAAVLLAIMLVPLFVREREASQVPPEARLPAAPGFELEAIARALGQAFSLRSTLVAALLMLAMNFTIGMMSATGYLLFVGSLGWSYDSYLEITGGWGLAIGCGCAAATGFLVDRFGRRRIAAAASIALAAGWAVFAFARGQWTNTTLVYAMGLYEGACGAVLNVALIALCMDLSWPRIAGSQFAAYMALLNFSTTLGYQFAAKANALWEFHGVYLVAAAIQLAGTLILVPIDPRQTRRELRDDSPIRWPGVGALLALLAFLVAMTGYITLQRLGYL
jgi:MFS transporter, PAT family, beta-lactamase induction signal transducer AmpG